MATRAWAMMLGGLLCATAATLPARPAAACGGWAEWGGSCGGSDASEARWMLDRVAKALKANEAGALQDFTRGANGFRTQDLYVFCIGPDGRMSAHPDPELMGKDARALRDPTGKAFAAEMLDVAKEGALAEVSYLFPRPGSSKPVPKTSFVTRIGDQVCGAGYYEDADSAEAAAKAPPAVRLQQLRQSLEAGMPDQLRPDWTSFLALLQQQSEAQAASLAKARASVRAAQDALGPEPNP